MIGPVLMEKGDLFAWMTIDLPKVDPRFHSH